MIEPVKTFLASLSSHPGVYQMRGTQGEILYVGKAKDLKKRVSSYFSRRVNDLKTLSLIKHTHDIQVIVTNSETEAVLLECNLIKKHHPRYNVLLRDDKSYPYILITTEHAYPRIDLYRGPRRKQGLCFGPYPHSSAVRETIQLLQKLFRLRTCSNHYFEARLRPCLLYQIGRCTGPCVELISRDDYQQNVDLAILFLKGKNEEVIHALQTKMETASQALDFERAAQYRDQIARLRQIQERQVVNVAHGDADILGFAERSGMTCLQVLSIRGGQLLGSLSYFPRVPPHSKKAEILMAFLTQHYLASSSRDHLPKQIIIDTTLPGQAIVEQVLTEQENHSVQLLTAKRGEKKKWLLMAHRGAEQSLATHLAMKATQHERLKALQEALQLKKIPQRMECFDVSHTLGEATVASCVVFDEAGPVKSAYRRFNITDITPGDDVAAMRQVLQRRFKRLQQTAAPLADIIFIDGGKTQLKAVQDVLSSLTIDGILLIGISKGPARKPGCETLHRVDQSPLHLPADSLALHTIQHIRDEAHRFAITAHRQRRDKKRRQSSLEWIPGIGAKRRRELLRYFGGIQGLAHASLEDLIQVPGISRALADRIIAALHDTTL